MKRLFLVFVLMFVTSTILSNSSSMAQAVITSESFDGTTFVPNGWSLFPATSTSQAIWSRRTAGTVIPHSGVGMVSFRSSSTGTAIGTQQSLISPAFDLSNRSTNNVGVRFWMFRDSTLFTNVDSIDVFINTVADTLNASKIGTVVRNRFINIPDTLNLNGWVQYSFNFPASYTGSTNYVIIRGTCRGGVRMYIDDVEFYSNPNNGLSMCLPSYVPTNGLVGWWPFCGNANDESGNGHHATIFNGVTLTADRNGNSNRAYSLDGIDDYIQVNNLINSTSNSISFSFWAKLNSSVNASIISLGGVSGCYNASHVSFYSNPACINGSVALNINCSEHNKNLITSSSSGWSYYCITYSGGKLSTCDYYQNGVLLNSSCNFQGNDANINLLGNFLLSFGKTNSPILSCVGGLIDDIGIWNRALSPSEIQALYLSGQPSPCLNMPTSLFSQDSIAACGKNYTLTPTSAGISNPTYAWNTGATSATLAVTQSGWYTCTINSGFCTVTDSVYVSLLNINLGNDTSICVGQSLVFYPSVNGQKGILSSNMPGIPSYVPTSGLVGWWPFNGNANDESGNGNHGTVNGAALSMDRFGGSNSAYNFSQWLNVINLPELSTQLGQPYSSMTISLWFKAGPSGASEGILFHSSSTSQYIWGRVALNSGNLFKIYHRNPNSNIEPSYTTNSLIGQWSNVIIRMDGINGTYQFFLNGTLIPAMSFAYNSALNYYDAGRFWGIGAISSGYPSSHQFIGDIDDIGIWNRALTPTEIQSLYSSMPLKYTWSTGDTTSNIHVSPTQTTTYYCTVSNGINTCTDSMIVFVKPNSSHFTQKSICLGSTYIWNNTTYAQAISDTVHLTNYVGCDSVDILNLSILTTSQFTTQKSICPGASYVWNNTSYTQAISDTVHLTNYLGCDSMDILHLSILPTSQFTTQKSICPGASYVWNNITYTQATRDTVHLTNYVGCDSIDILQLNILPTSQFTTQKSICPGASFVWNNTTYTQATQDTVHLTNYVGCDSMDILHLSIYGVVPPIVSALGATQFCQGKHCQLFVAPHAGTLQWYNGATLLGQTNDSLLVTQSGTYYVELTDTNQCVTSSIIRSVAVYNLPLVGIQVIGNNPLCIGQSVILQGYGATNYTWDQGIQNGQAFVPQQTNTYTITGTDAHQCSNTATVTVIVNPLPVSQTIIGNPSIVPFQTYTYTVNPTPGINFNWSIQGGAIQTGQGTNNVSVVWGNAGPYSVQLVQSNTYGCTDTSFLVVINSNCSLSYNVFSQTKNPLCQGDSILCNVQITAPSSFQWFKNGQLLPGATDDSLWVKSSGTYQVQISAGNCTTLSNGNSFLFVNAPAIPHILLLDTIGSSCGINAIVLGSSLIANSYVWSDGTNQAIDTVHSSGTYSLTVKNSTGCGTTSNPLAVNMSSILQPSLCIVTVDSATSKNKLVWEKPSKQGIDSFYIYKETSTLNQFTRIGAVGVNDWSEYIDISSNPAQQADRYRLSVLDSCGVEGLPSGAHQTIHLTINQGLGSVWNLIWTPYQGINFSSYKIYRADASGTVQLLSTVASAITSYTDLNPPAGVQNYYVSVLLPQSCASTQKQSVVTESYSNKVAILSNTGVAVALQNTSIKIYPVPATTYLIVSGVEMAEKMEMTDILGRVVLRAPLEIGSTRFDLQDIAPGVYTVRVGTVLRRVIVAE